MADRIRDIKVKGKFFINDAYINGYAKYCGVYGTGVYNAICRHASAKQTAFPGIDRMAKKLNISRSSVIRGIEKLEEYNIIKVVRKKDLRGRQRVNTYTLLDKSVWKPIGASEMDSKNEKPSLSQTQAESTTDKSRVSEVDCKVTQYKVTQYKEAHIRGAESCSQEEIVEAYHEILPELPKVVKLTDKRKEQLAAICNENENWRSLVKWRGVFELVRGASFLLGNNDRGWKPDLEWITKEDNFIKIIEGKYHN